MGMVKKHITIHAHFYQPPRENPWSGVIYEEPTNPFYKNFNDMITDECYGPLSEKTIKSDLNEYLSVYSFINFNFGPTLLNYIEKEYSKLYLSIIEADIFSKKIFGLPNAIAQVYNHSILPLLTLKKKRLYTKWGIENFKRHFKREPKGMWLSETAVDNETLEVLIEQNIEFTILSPTQAKKTKNLETGTISNISSFNELDTSHYYLWKSKEFKGKQIKIFFYDKEVSDKMLTEIENTKKYLLRIKNSFIETEKKNQFCLIASDGENYGHHIKKGNEYLSVLIKKIKSDRHLSLQNLSNLSELKSEFEVEIKSPSSWSCEHGVRRWEDECSCRINPNYKYQKWKKRLKESVDEISEKADEIYIKNTILTLKEPIKAIEKYITSYERSDPHLSVKFVEENCKKRLSTNEIISTLKALNSQIDLAFAYTSCGWFFDDITNLETLNNIKRIIKLKNYLNENGINVKHIIEKLKKEKTNTHKNLEEEIENIERYEGYEKICACEFVLLSSINFINPFSKAYYRAKLINRTGNFYAIKIQDIRTFEETLWSVFISKEKENLLIRVKKSEVDDFKKIEKKDFTSFSPLTLLDLSPDFQKIYIILTSTEEKYSEAKKLLYAISNFDCSNESILKIKNSYLSSLYGYRPMEIPMIRDITKLVIKFIDTTQPLDKDILNAISEKGLMSWKLKIYDNKKILS